MKQLIIAADMEGATGIFEYNKELCYNGGDAWRAYGRDCITSDVKAVCDAANECGVDDIMLYDMHYAGNPEFNIKIENLPKNVRVFDIPNRCFFWRRIRGQAHQNPFGLITVGQHSRYGENNAYFPHSIQSPPIMRLAINGLSIAEIGQTAFNFLGTPYIANIGCAASHKEAKEICGSVSCISVKDKSKNWEPACGQTYPIIKSGVIDAIKNISDKEKIKIEEPCLFELTLCDGYRYPYKPKISWKGSFDKNTARWKRRARK